MTTHLFIRYKQDDFRAFEAFSHLSATLRDVSKRQLDILIDQLNFHVTCSAGYVALVLHFTINSLSSLLANWDDNYKFIFWPSLFFNFF
jgi:hypothetical protein